MITDNIYNDAPSCDPRFFYKKHASTALSQIVAVSHSQIAEANDNNNERSSGDYEITDIATLSSMAPHKLSVYHNAKYSSIVASLSGGLCLTTTEYVSHIPQSVRVLVSRSPYSGFAKIASYFYVDIGSSINYDNLRAGPNHSFIAASANVPSSCTLAPGVVIGDRVTLGENTTIGANTVLFPGVIIGDNCQIGANVTISHTIMGDNVQVHHGTHIGKSGFGFHLENGQCTMIPQLGRVVIANEVMIGSNVNIDRGSLDDTVIGQGTMIDNLVQIAHNVKIGKYCIIVAQVGIAGSTVIEDEVALGGQVGLAGHLTIGRGAKVAAQAGVASSVEPGQAVGGSPAMPIRDWQRLFAIQRRLVKR